MDRGFPVVVLKRQFRSHDQLYSHTADIIYPKDNIESEYMTINPSDFLKRILEKPVYATTTEASYRLSSFSHFLDVANGVQESYEAGSSWNRAEVEAVNGLVKGLLAIGVSAREIWYVYPYSDCFLGSNHGPGANCCCVVSWQGTRLK